jgi:hypothetical protein
LNQNQIYVFDFNMTPLFLTCGTFDEWDFPILAMSAARNNETEKAIEWLLDSLFQFDDVGMPIGGVRVPTYAFLPSSFSVPNSN